MGSVADITQATLRLNVVSVRRDLVTKKGGREKPYT